MTRRADLCSTEFHWVTCRLTSGPACSVCVVRSVIWQSEVTFRAALALSCIRNKHNQPRPRGKETNQTRTSNGDKLEELHDRLEDLGLDASGSTDAHLHF